MSDEPRALEWARFTGAFANGSQIAAGDRSVIGVAPDICPCCDERYVVIAAVHSAGFEISVSLPPEQALAVANQILDAYAKVTAAPVAVRQ